MDRFMRLTDRILFIIVSFLSFKEAARTCVLSKRWRHIWRATKNIEFDERFFVRVGEPEENQAAQRLVFFDFARQWMENYKEPYIENFHLRCLKPGNFREDMEHFIAFAMRLDVKALGLDFSDPTWIEEDLENPEPLFDLPLNVYGHAVLESLKLFSCSFRLSEVMNFGALKHLSFGWLELKVSAIDAILRNCPLLESLSLKNCWNLECLHIEGPNLELRSLTVDKCDFNQEFYYIEAPKLRFLKYSGFAGIFEIEISRNCMKEADLDFDLEAEFDEAAGSVLYKVLENLYPVRVLTICSYMLQVMPCGEEPLSMGFPLNVMHLILKTAMHEYEFYGIRFFLNSCHYLETLTIQVGPGRIFEDYEPPFELDPAEFWRQCPSFECLGNTLRVVEVKGFQGTSHELSLLRYLVFNSRVLERLNITVAEEGEADGGNVEEYHRRAQSVQTFQKASAILQISIH